MIAPLRRRHRFMASTLLVAMPVVLVVSLRARPPEYHAKLPAELTDPGFEGGKPYDVFGELGVAVRGIAAADGALLELAPAEPLVRPDVLLYWSSEEPRGESGGLPDGSILLGAVGERPRSYFLPSEAATSEGYLTLYSLAHQEVVGSGPLPAVAEPLPPLEEDEP